MNTVAVDRSQLFFAYDIFQHQPLDGFSKKCFSFMCLGRLIHRLNAFIEKAHCLNYVMDLRNAE